MMLRGGDLNLNRSVQSFGDLTMERLKQVMLQHELMFRNQVCDLHRLYWTQKDLMNELRIKGMDTDAPSSYSWLCKESEEKKNTFSISSGAKEGRNVGALDEFKGSSTYLLKRDQRKFSLHISADEFLSSKGKDPAFCHQAIKFRGKEVIDLESSVIKLEFHEAAKDQFFSGGFSAQMQNSPSVFGAQASVPSALISSSITGNDLSRMASLIHLNEEIGGQLQEKKPPFSYSELGDSCVDASVNQPLKKQQAKPVLFDLNLPHEDEWSHDLKGLRDQEDGNSFPTETSFVAKPTLSDPATKISCENETSNFIFHGEDSTSADCSLNSKLDLNTTDDKNNTASGCQIKAECCEGSTYSSDQVSLSKNAFFPSSIDLCKQTKGDFDIKGQDSNITSSNSINLPQTVNKDSATKPTNHEGSEEDTSSSHAVTRDEIAPSIKFLAECNSHRITRNNESSNTDDSVTTQLNSQNEGFFIGKLIPEEWDSTIISAAKALMSIPLGCFVPNELPRNIDSSNLPQYSSDSFERMTLELSEVQSEDRRATTEPSNANKTEKNEGVVRLRRGRGFRDFQKEVLPGLVTLSRHEICEDLHNIGYKLKRLSSRNNGDNWFVSARSRRSKLCSGRRRRLSSP